MTGGEDGPAVEGATHLVIAHLSDLHVGDHRAAVAEDLVLDVAAAAPAVTIVTGDLTMRGRTRELASARSLLDLLPRPRLVVIGNHDVPLAPVSRLAAPYSRYRSLIDPELDPVLRADGCAALGLRSAAAWRWKGGHVSRSQAASVARILTSPTGTPVRILALHHSPFGRRLARVVGSRPLLRALVEARVELVLAGHTHVPAVRHLELRSGPVLHRLVESIAGTATSRRTRGTPCSWNLIRLQERATTVEVRYHDRGTWRTERILRYPRSPGYGEPSDRSC